MRSKFFLVALFIFLVLFILIMVLYFWFTNKQERLNESNKMLSTQYINENVATLQTPEQTYEKLREYLNQGEINKATDLFIGKYQSRYQEIFSQAKKENKLKELAGKLDSKIKKSATDCLITHCTYIMENSRVEIDFIKDENGVWRVEAL